MDYDVSEAPTINFVQIKVQVWVEKWECAKRVPKIGKMRQPLASCIRPSNKICHAGNSEPILFHQCIHAPINSPDLHRQNAHPPAHPPTSTFMILHPRPHPSHFHPLKRNLIHYASQLLKAESVSHWYFQMYTLVWAFGWGRGGMRQVGVRAMALVSDMVQF